MNPSGSLSSGTSLTPSGSYSSVYLSTPSSPNSKKRGGSRGSLEVNDTF